MNRSEHSPIGASSYYRWSECPGSVRLCVSLPPVSPGIYAEEGTIAHGIAARVIQTGHWPVTIDPETRAAIVLYVDEVYRGYEKGDTVLVEHGFDLESVYPNLYGTADAVVYQPNKKLLRVIDYKHGAGIPVEVYDGKPNPQAMYYALGALLTTDFRPDLVELVIVQPRCEHPKGPVRRYSLLAIELLDFAAELKAAAIRTEDPHAKLIPSSGQKDYCRFCPGAGACPALRERAVALAKEEFSPRFSYDPEKLSQALEWLPTIEGWAKSVREFAYGEARHGRCPPGWKLVEKRITRQWRDPDEAALFLELETGLMPSEYTVGKLASPAAVEKLLTKPLQDKIKGLISAESSGTSLVHESDKRPKLSLSAKDEFSPIEAEFKVFEEPEEKSILDISQLRDEAVAQDVFS